MRSEEAILLLVIVLGAFFVPFLSRRILLPTPVGEILFGVIMGLCFKDVSPSIPTVKFLSDLGFLILMYLAGLEIDFPRIRSAGKKEFSLYLFFIALVAACSWYAMVHLHQPLVYALVYLTTAIGLLVPVLKETELLKKDFGQSFLVLGGLGEIFTMLAIVGFTLYLEYGLSRLAAFHSLKILSFFFVCYLLLRLFWIFIWWNPTKVGVFLRTGDITETGIRANFVNMFVFVSLATLLNIEPIIGAFFGGLLFALVFREREEVLQKLSALGYGFLIPIFFIEVGFRFDLASSINYTTFRDAAMISAVMFVTRLVSLPALFFSRLSWRYLTLVPFGLSFPLTLLVAVATVGVQIHALAQEQGATIILAAIITSLVYPWAFKVLSRHLLPTEPSDLHVPCTSS